YNGIEFEIAHISKWDEDLALSDDGTDGLYDHVHIGLTCVFNPKATTSRDGALAVQSIAELRAKMLAPRGKLVLKFGNTIVLQSPGLSPGGNMLPCDAKNGPIPIAFRVMEITGFKTAIVYFEVETWVRLCPAGTKAVLSHRWE